VRGVSLGFFSGSRVFFLLGLGGLVGAFRVFFVFGCYYWGFFCFVKVSIMLVRGFLVGSLWFFGFFMWAS